MPKTQPKKIDTVTGPATVSSTVPAPGHLQVTVSGPVKHVMAALTSMKFQQPAASNSYPFLSDVLCLNWIGLSATVDNIDDTETIQTFWEHNAESKFSFSEQVSLARVIKQQYNGKTFSPETLAPETKISDLEHWIPATL